MVAFSVQMVCDAKMGLTMAKDCNCYNSSRKGYHLKKNIRIYKLCCVFDPGRTKMEAVKRVFILFLLDGKQ